MEIETPAGIIAETTPIKTFVELTTISNSQYILGIENMTSGKGARITFENLITSIISGNSDNRLVKGTDDKLYVSKPIEIGSLADLTTSNKTNLVSAINEVNAHIGDISNLDTSDKSSLVNAVNEIYGATGMSLDLMNQTKGMLTGNTNNNASIYNDVLQYAHSTYDSNKFSVYGTGAVISDNGIASGFSSTSGVDTIYKPLPDTASWECKLRYTCNISTHNEYLVYNVNGDVGFTCTQASDGNSLGLYIFPEGGGSSFAITAASLHLATNDIVDLIGGYNASEQKYYIKVYKNGVLAGSNTSAVTTVIMKQTGIGYLRLGFKNGNSSFNTGTIDLKYFSFSIAGQIVFSGNKTDIDTIISSDYTVVGSPTITNNILSGLSSSNYLTKSLNMSGSSLKVRVPFKVTAINTTQSLIDNTYVICRLLYVSGDTALYPSVQVSDGNSNKTFRTSSVQIQTNTDYIYEMIYNITSCTIKLYSADGTLLDYWTSTSTDNLVIPNSVQTTRIGYNSGNTSIDLAGVEVLNDSLIYRPVFIIPYSLSKTGSKVVDVAYRDRVQDMHRLYGYAPYYTIDEANQNYTLPMGEVYGMIDNAVKNDTDYITTLPAIQNKGETIYNEKGEFYKLEKDTHSIFDGSKFTAVGSPAITNDGIASGFSINDYVETTVNSPFDNNYIFEIGGSFVFNATTTVQNEDVWYLSWKCRGRVEYSTALQKHRFLMQISANTNYIQTIISLEDNGFVNGDTVYYRYISNGLNSRTLMISKDRINWITESNTTAITTANIADYNSTKFRIGSSGTTGEYFPSSINLKDFYIINNSIPFFNGNKTGIDTIKPDDYTVVGSPTISADGVASGLIQNTDYISSNTFTDLTNADNWDITLGFSVKSFSSMQYLLDSINTLGLFNLGIFIRTSGKLSWGVFTSSGSTEIAKKDTSTTFSIGTKYFVKLSYTGSKYSFSIWNGSEWVEDTSVTTSNKIGNVTQLYIGTGNSSAFSGDVDLNLFQVYVNGDLVYQPCLKIPYNISKDGKKIADIVYVNRVNDVYNQSGSANYVVLDELNQKYILPQGSIYGMIQNVSNSITSNIMPDYDNGINISLNTDYTVPSNGWVLAIGDNNGGSFTINSRTWILCNYNTTGTDQNSMILPVSKGDMVKLTYTGQATGQLTFYPCKGV